MQSCRAASLIIIFLLFAMQVSVVKARGQEETAGSDIFGFAEALFEEGDYFRAIGEYKRYIFFHSAEPPAERASFRIAEAYYQAKRWSEAIDACQRFLLKYPDSPLYFKTLYLKGRVEKLDNRFAESLRTFDAIVAAKAAEYGDKALYQKALLYLERKDWQGARDLALQVPRTSPLYNLAAAFAREIAGGEALPHKSPVTAGLLAAVLPGAGHLYAGRPQDAVTAFLLNGAFIWGAVELFQHDNNVTGGIVTFFEIGWYTGSIYSAISSIHKYNRRQEEDFVRHLEERFSLSYHREGGVPTILIGKKF